MNREKLQRAIQKFARVRLRKIHLDLFVGILSIPVLITAIIINWSNLTKKQTTTIPVASPTPKVIIVPQSPLPTKASCIKLVGPIAITSPNEGQRVAANPVCITIDYSDPTFCPVIWSYRINGGAWSDFNTSSPCLYNLPNEPVQFDLRVNSTVSSDARELTRNFVYTGSTTIATPTPTPTLQVSPSPSPAASSSASQ